jgi:hypothetical protein
MTEDDMSHMHDVFFNRELPFPEYIVESGYHHISREVIDHPSPKPGAIDRMREKYGYHYRALYVIPRAGGGQVQVSVISGMMFYSSKEKPYEVKVTPVFDRDAEDDDPLAYQTDEDLILLWAKIIEENRNDTRTRT